MALKLELNSIHTPKGPLLGNVHIHIAAGQIATLMGPSGCGKSTVLAAVAGIVPVFTDAPKQAHSHIPVYALGRVVLNGVDISQYTIAQRQVGLLFQDDLLFPHMSVQDNLLFACPAGDQAQRLSMVNTALQDAGMSGFGAHDPSTLSGGQRARIAVMRALLAQPKALLLDEPFSKLDTALRSQFRQFVFEHIRARNIPALLVSHDSMDIADDGCVYTVQANTALGNSPTQHTLYTVHHAG